MTHKLILGAFCLLHLACFNQPDDTIHLPPNMLIRMAELEIDSSYVNEYLTILKDEAAESIHKEKGVICIYPMFQKDKPTIIKLLEIYADQASYESHLKTPHFMYYKTKTEHMVRSLRLIDMEAIDKETMPLIFSRLKE